ncbi:hypothetical protein ACJIZ3_003379 [Penstemon smallii]|uniref:Uncharacterized protein n=1 Tax=Penstemon smallii TaxID=265156 RepID=A0ABD3U951_9LAMI
MYEVIAICIGMPCIMSCKYRKKMRIKFRLIESPAPDWLVHCFCECCRPFYWNVRNNNIYNYPIPLKLININIFFKNLCFKLLIIYIWLPN